MLNVEFPENVVYASLVFAVLMPSKDPTLSGDLVDDRWINKCIARVLILGFIVLIFTSNIQPTQGAYSQLEKADSKQEYKHKSDECFKSKTNCYESIEKRVTFFYRSEKLFGGNKIWPNIQRINKLWGGG